MIGTMEFGGLDAFAGNPVIETFHWRDHIRIAVYQRHPSGRELVAVIWTGIRAGQKLPKR